MGILSGYLPDLLPDDPTQNTAARQGLLAFGASLLGGRGNLGGILGGGLAAGMQGYNGSLQQQQQAALAAAQKQRLDLDNQETQAKLDEPAQIASIFGGAGPAAVGTTRPVGAVSGLPRLNASSQSKGVSTGGSGPYSSAEASAAYRAASQAGMSGYEPEKLNQVMALARQGMTADQAAKQVFGAGSTQLSPQPSPMPDSGATQQATAGILPVSSLPQLGASAAASSPAPSVTPSDYEQLMDWSKRATVAGRPVLAKQYYDMALKSRPEVQEVKTALDTTGKPVQVITFKDGSQKTSDYGALPDNQVVDLGGTQVLVDKNTGKQAASFAKSQSPDNIATNATTRRGQDMAHRDSDPQAPITDAAILNAAARYNLDGTLPPMGMGANAAAGRSAILNKAAELASGVDPTQQRKDQLSAKGNAAAQNTAVREFSTGKLGNSVRSFNVLQSHLDTMGNMADALNNGDTQLFNKMSNTLAAQTGQAAPTNFEAVKHIVGDEIVKAVTGSAGALGDREAAAKTIASVNSPAQLRGVIETYKELARGQLTGLRQQYQTSTGRDDFDKFLSPSSKAAVAPMKDLPKKVPAASAQAYADPAKEARYQEWKRSQGQ